MTNALHHDVTSLTPTSKRPVAPVTQAGLVEVFRRSDVAAWGLDPGIVRTYLRQGVWTRLHRGVYTDTGILIAARRSPERLHRLLTRAAIAALPVPAYAFGPTAALAHGLPLPTGLPDTVNIIRRPSADQRALRRRISAATLLDGVQVHRHWLAEDDVTEIDGLPTVSRDVAAVTSAARCTAEWAVALLDAASWQRGDAAETLGLVIDDWAQLRGIGVVRAALALARTGAQSPFESLSRVRLMERGIPEPRLQAAFHDEDGLIGYVDMVWDEWGVIGECDGLLKYSGPEDVIREKAREDRLRALGYVVVRWTWNELMTNPAKVVARIRRARALAARFR